MLRPVARNPEDDSLVSLASLGRVEDHQVSHPKVAVMPGDDGRHLGGMSRHGPGKVEGVGPVGVAPVVFPLVGAVRIHRKQKPSEEVGHVGVFPAGEHHAPGGEHAGIVVVVLVEGELADLARCAVQQIQAPHVVQPVPARHRLVTGRGAEEDPAVGQVAGVVVVDVAVPIGRHPCQAGAVDADLEDLPAVVLGHGEEHAPGVEIQIDLAHEEAAGRAEERGQLCAGPDGREHGNLVVVARTPEAEDAVVIDRQPQGLAFEPLDVAPGGLLRRAGLAA